MGGGFSKKKSPANTATTTTTTTTTIPSAVTTAPPPIFDTVWDEFKHYAAQMGVTRVVFVRHANAEPARGPKGEYKVIHDWQIDDQKRALTDKGKEQAKEAQTWFKNDVGQDKCKVLTGSGARRAVETLQVMASTVEETNAGQLSSVAVALVPSLHPANVHPPCEKLFDVHGYGPLSTFFAMDGGKDAMTTYADKVVVEMIAGLKGLPSTPANFLLSYTNTMAYWGHAVFLNAIAYTLSSNMGATTDVLTQLEMVDLGEAEGLLIEFTPGTALTFTHLHCRKEEEEANETPPPPAPEETEATLAEKETEAATDAAPAEETPTEEPTAE